MTTSSIWQDPWIAAATCSTPTTLPPPRPCLPTGVLFKCCTWTDLSQFERSEWRDLVQTCWTLEQLTIRLHDAHIARLLHDNVLIGTCVLRPRENHNWILETLVVKQRGRGFGTLVMRAAIRWIWSESVEPPSISFVWELSPLGLLKAAWAGWLSCAHRIELGWIWTKSTTSCQTHCQTEGIYVVSDSGLGDRMGYVVSHTGVVDWDSVCAQGGWTTLWLVSSPNMSSPNSWKWTGEFVVTAVLNGSLRSVYSPYEVAVGNQRVTI